MLARYIRATAQVYNEVTDYEMVAAAIDRILKRGAGAGSGGGVAAAEPSA